MVSKIIEELRKIKIDHSVMSDKEVLEASKILNEMNESALQRFSTGVVTALPVEMAALESCFDNIQNIEMRGINYKIGSASIRGSNSKKIISVLKRASDMGNNMSAICASNMLNAFPNIDDIIMVGIAAGMPYPENPEKHVRLGDIVVSDQQGVTQYDFGKQYKDHFEEKQRGRPPSPKLIDSVNELSTLELKGDRPWEQHIANLMIRLNWNRPNAETDKIFDAEISEKEIEHPVDPQRISDAPRIFRGKIGSANLVLKSGKHRRKLRERHNVIAVEMEASGIADAAWSQRAGYLVIRGICDYADRNKNDEWHKYASLVAAAYCKAILEL